MQSIAKGQVDLDTEEEKKADEPEREQQRKDFAALLSWLAAQACRPGEGGTALLPPHHLAGLPRRRRARHDPDPGEDVPRDGSGTCRTIKRILELNPTHPLVAGLRKAHEQRADADGLAETAELLYGMALLAEGGELGDPARFARLLADRLASAL